MDKGQRCCAGTQRIHKCMRACEPGKHHACAYTRDLLPLSAHEEEGTWLAVLVSPTVEGSTLSLPVCVTSSVNVPYVTVHPHPSAQAETLGSGNCRTGLHFLGRRVL